MVLLNVDHYDLIERVLYSIEQFEFFRSDYSRRGADHATVAVRASVLLGSPAQRITSSA